MRRCTCADGWTGGESKVLQEVLADLKRFIFNPKNCTADFGNSKQGLLIMKLIHKSNFTVQGMFFNHCIEKNQSKLHCDDGTSESPHTTTIYGPPIFEGFVSHYKKLHYDFPKMSRGGLNAVWNFSENSSDLVALPVPQLDVY